MNIVIQCAKRKSGNRFRDAEGCPVTFVADPAIAPQADRERYVHPDDLADDGRPWRQHIVEYNRRRTNEYELSPAYRLYVHPTYGNLVDHYGLERITILSAGWGLIPASFLTPYYDITFSTNKNVDAWAVRRTDSEFKDLCCLPEDSEDPLVFLGGTAYVKQFAKLSRRYRGPKIVVYCSQERPMIDQEYLTVRYPGSTRTNWHYGCAKDMIAGQFDPVQLAGL
jgi:hypothetical protein